MLNSMADVVYNMDIHESSVFKGVWFIQPKVFGDQRGYFVETYSQRELEHAGAPVINWVQDNASLSSKNVLRGLHFQLPPFAQAKLVGVAMGEVLDVIVDIRPDSPTFGLHESVILSTEKQNKVLVPHGFAHGYLVLSDQAIFTYKCDNYYFPEQAKVIRWDSLDIDWGVVSPILAQKDAEASSFTDMSEFLKSINW
jgi:dTDP-4-dehydrorhamnose 3,5-epimerase